MDGNAFRNAFIVSAVIAFLAGAGCVGLGVAVYKCFPFGGYATRNY